MGCFCVGRSSMWDERDEKGEEKREKQRVLSNRWENGACWATCESESRSVVSDGLWLHRLCRPWTSPGQNAGVGNLSIGHLPNPGIKPRSPELQADSLSAEPQGKTKNTGVGSLSLFQWIFPTQELNQGLLHWRQILYQLSYQGSWET